MDSINLTVNQANAELMRRWNQPTAGFASGKDPRSSDAGLLEKLYGGMEHAARYQWLNGGRTLIDKTYLAMFCSAQQLTPPSIGFEKLAANLDRFIREQLAERWEELPDLEHDARHQLAVELVQKASTQLFGSQPNLCFASQLLLFLCPQLPVFPVDESTPAADENYAEYHQRNCNLLAHNFPILASKPMPLSATSDVDLGRLLSQTDWWVRRLLIKHLTQQSLAMETATQPTVEQHLQQSA